MAYCTVEEVQAYMKEDYINQVIANEYLDPESVDRDAVLIPLLETAIQDAGSEIDGYLGKRYTVPLSPVPPVINKFAKDIAVYNFGSRAGLEDGDREGNYLTRYKSAVKFLTLVAEGKVSIGAGGIDPATAARTGFSVHSNSRLFRRDSMRGM